MDNCLLGKSFYITHGGYHWPHEPDLCIQNCITHRAWHLSEAPPFFFEHLTGCNWQWQPTLHLYLVAVTVLLRTTNLSETYTLLSRWTQYTAESIYLYAITTTSAELLQRSFFVYSHFCTVFHICMKTDLSHGIILKCHIQKFKKAPHSPFDKEIVTETS